MLLFCLLPLGCFLTGDGSQETDSRDSYSENRSAFPAGRQNWNMEFKDAASAAQAAAESAERASMAARAAAELSNRENITRQYSSGSHSSSGSSPRDGVPKEYAFHDDKHLSTGSVNSTFRRSSSGMHRNSHQNVVKHAQSASLISGGASGDDKPFTDGSQMADIYHHDNLFEEESNDLHDMSIKKQASRTEDDFVTELHGDGDLNTENNYHFGHTSTNRQSRKASSSHPIIPSDDHNDNLNLNDWRTVNKAGEDLFVTDVNTKTNTMETSSYNETSAVFDDSESEDDDYKFDADRKYKGEGSSLFFSSSGSKSQVDPLENTNSWSHGQNIDERETSSGTQSHFSVVPERLTKSEVSFEKEDLSPVTFDDSDDQGSDSEVNLVKSKVSGTFGHGNSVLDQIPNHGALESSSRNVKNHGTDRKSLSSPSSVGSANVEERFERKGDITTVSEKNHGYDELPTSEPSSTRRSSISGSGPKANIHALQSPNNFNDTETLEKSRMESEAELNYGTLKGGLRNKGYRRPPYVKNTSDDVSSSLGNISIQNERSLPTLRTSISSDAPVQDKYTTEVSRRNRNVGLRAHNTSSDSDSYVPVANTQETTSTHEPRIQREQSEARKKSTSRASIPYFDSGDSDSEDELHKQNSSSLARPVSGTSRRTSASPKTGTGLSSKDAPLSETPGARGGWKSSRASYESKNQKASSIMKSSENWAGSKPGSAENEAKSRPITEPNRSLDEEIMYSSARVQPSSSLPKTVIQNNEEGQEASKSLNSGEDALSKQKASHTHPKLPDYDSFAAHFLSLKKGRQ